MNCFRNSLKYAAINPKSDRFDCLNNLVKVILIDGGTDRNLPLLFREYPSLVSDVHDLIKVMDESEIDAEPKRQWLLGMAECIRTKEVLRSFLIDPEQINSLKSDEFWLQFMSRFSINNGNVYITAMNNNFNFEWFDKVNQWSNEKLVNEFVNRSRSVKINSDFHDLLLKMVIFKKKNIFNNEIDTKFILTRVKDNSELFNWILDIFTIEGKQIISTHLIDLVPLKNSKIAKKLFNLVELRPFEELIDEIFKIGSNSNNNSNSNSNSNSGIQALAEWNLWIESDNFVFDEDEQFQSDDKRCNNYKNEDEDEDDFGFYLENLFSELVADSNVQLVKESNDPIEMYLEYFKYGQYRSMRLLQPLLESTNKLIDLLLKIPLVVLKASGPDFGAAVLNEFVEGKWGRENLEIIWACGNEGKLDELKMYYKNRIRKK